MLLIHLTTLLIGLPPFTITNFMNAIPLLAYYLKLKIYSESHFDQWFYEDEEGPI